MGSDNVCTDIRITTVFSIELSPYSHCEMGAFAAKRITVPSAKKIHAGALKVFPIYGRLNIIIIAASMAVMADTVYPVSASVKYIITKSAIAKFEIVFLISNQPFLIRLVIQKKL